MAEVLGLASSIVALVQLSAAVYSTTSRFYREAKEAKSKISALATQARNLSGVLQSLSLLASSPLFDDVGAAVPDFRDTYIESCRNTLYKIKRKLEKAESDLQNGSHRKLVARSLKWPFESQETTDLIAELTQHREVLQLALSAETMSHLLQCLANTNSIARSVDILNRKLDRKASIDTRAELTAKREEVVRFFLKVNPEDHLQDCRNRRQPNTGKWLIERDPTFRSWMSSPGSRIWLSGIPGAGKTILCGTIVEEILQEQTPSTAVAFFFCDHKSTESQKPVNILASLAVQLAKQADAAFALLESYYETLHPQNRIARPPEIEDIIQVVSEMINEYDCVYLAIDGIDECGSNMVNALQSLKQLEGDSQVNMALFSRNEPDIMEELSDSPRIEIAAHTEDLELYVLAQMESRKRLGSLAIRNPDLHEHIRHTLIEGANGMFRWVACQLDHLDGLPSDGRRRKALKELPPTLFETYDRILDRIMQEDEHDQEICRRALHWIGLKDNTLNVLALCEAISIPDDEDAVDIEQLVDPDWVSRRCSSLIRMVGSESEHPHFQFAHFTVREYLRSIKPQSTRSFFRSCDDEAIRDRFRASLRFLTFSIFDRNPTIASSEIQRMAERNEQHPFYPVAAEYMFCSRGEYHEDTYLSSALEDEATMQYAKTLFSPAKTGIFLSWVLQATWTWPDLELDEGKFSSIIGLLLAPEFSPLHVAAMLALPSICAHLIEDSSVDVNVCCRLGTPLHALLAGLRLLHPGDNFNYDAELHYRNIHRDEDPKYDLPQKCLKILLDNGADTSIRWNDTSIFEMVMNNSIRSEDEKTWTLPLITRQTPVTDDDIESFARDLTKEDIERPILDAIVTLGSDPDTAPGWARLASLIQTRRIRGEHPLEANGSQFGPQARISDEDFADGIKFSISQDLTHFLKDLLQDPRFKHDLLVPVHKSDPMPVLHFAVKSISLKSVELLLEAGCNPNVVDESDGWTALHLSAVNDTDEAAVTALLLKSGAVDTVKDELGRTCWHIAAEQDSISVLKVLINIGSDSKQLLATASNIGRSPLASAVHRGRAEAAAMLLDHCDAKLEYFQSDRPLLDVAGAMGSKDLFTKLLDKLREAGATEAIESSKPLRNISMQSSTELVDYLFSSWARDEDSKALTNFLLRANDDVYKDRDTYPSRAHINHVVAGLLPSDHVLIHDGKPQTQFWEIFCEVVVPFFTRACDHEASHCRAGLIGTIFEVLIATGALASYEEKLHLPGYVSLFRALRNRGDLLNCSWIAPSVHKVIQAHSQHGGLVKEPVCIELLSNAVRMCNIQLSQELLDGGVDVHTAHGNPSPLEQVCFATDRHLFDMILRKANRSLIGKVGSRGMTLLHWLVSGKVPGLLEKIDRILQLDASIIDVVDSEGDTALTMASRFRDQINTVQLLASRGANSLHRGRDGWTVLHAAASSGDLRYIQPLAPSKTPMSFWLGLCNVAFTGLIEKPMDIENSAVIHIAARNGRTNLLNYLIQKSLPLNVNAVTGWPFLTPLHLAASFGHLEFVEVLISCGAKVNPRDALGMLPIDHAAKQGFLTVFKALLKSGSEKPSTRFGESVADLISSKTEHVEDVEDSEAMSQFHFENAIIHGDLEVCKRLVEKGQSINAELLSRSYTPLVRAVVEGQEHIVDWLISRGVEVIIPPTGRVHAALRDISSLITYKIESTETLTAILSLSLEQNVSWYGAILGPLHIAVLDGNTTALDAILSHIRENESDYRRIIETEVVQLPTDITDWKDRSALSILVNEFNREEAFSNNPPWKRDFSAGSPLHWAIQEDGLAAVRLLLQNHADANQLDSSGKTPLYLAVSSKYAEEMVQELLHAGADSAGRLDALLEATRDGNLEVIKLLTEDYPELLTVADRLTIQDLLILADSVEIFQYFISKGLSPLNVETMELSTVACNITTARFRGFIFNSGLALQSTEKSISMAFFSALEAGDFTIIKMLHRTVPSGEFSALINSARHGMDSPLCVAASVNAEEQVENFITMGAQLDLEGCSHGSPLMVACALGCLDVVRQLVRAGAALCYVNEDGLLRSAVSHSRRHENVTRWLLVDRYAEQGKLEYQPSQSTSIASEFVWSGPRLFKLSLPAYIHREFGESRRDHLQRLSKWSKNLMGSTLAESRKGSGLAFAADHEAESTKREAQDAHRQFLVRLGEA